MRRLKWIIPIFAFALLVGGWLFLKYVVVGRQVGEDNLQGMTKQQIQARYGPPNFAGNHLWVYERGWIGGGTGISFRDGVVSDVEMRDAR